MEGGLAQPGIFLVHCHSVETVHADQHGDRKTVQLALRPANEGPHDSDYQERVRTNKSLLARCQESRAVVSKRFPDTLDDAGPRLSFREDLIYVASVLWPAPARQGMPAWVELEFERGWDELVHRLAFSCEKLFRPAGMIWQPSRPNDVDGFVEFLTTCTSLKQLVLSTQWGMTLDYWEHLDDEHRSALSREIFDCYGGLTCQPSGQLTSDEVNATRRLTYVCPAFVNELKSDRYPAPKGLEVSRMLHISRELRFLYRDFSS